MNTYITITRGKREERSTRREGVDHLYNCCIDGDPNTRKLQMHHFVFFTHFHVKKTKWRIWSYAIWSSLHLTNKTLRKWDTLSIMLANSA
jgi:hypothetical protein